MAVVGADAAMDSLVLAVKAAVAATGVVAVDEAEAEAVQTPSHWQHHSSPRRVHRSRLPQHSPRSPNRQLIEAQLPK
jgi:hypothetical protein